MPENNNSKGPNNLIEKSELTSEKLHDIFQAAYMKPEFDEEGYLRVQGRGRNGFRYIVQVWERRMVSVFGIIRFRDNVENIEKLEAVNKLNNEKVMVRFSVNRGGALSARYDLLIEEGVTPLQLLNAFTRFENVLIASVDEIKDLLG